MKWIKRLFNPTPESGDDLLQARLEALSAKASRFDRVFIGSYGYGFFDWDLIKGEMAWDNRFWGALGYTEADMEYISDAERFMEYVHEEDKEGLLKALHAHLRGHGQNDAVFRIRKKRGGYIWTEVRAGSVRNDKGWVTHMSGLILDLTRLKQTEQALLISEARHARILQSSNDGIWEWSAESGGFHFSNRCWEHLGYKDHDDVVNHGVDRVQAWRERMHPEDGRKFDRVLRNHIRRQGPFDVEYRIKGKDDSWCWIRARGQMAFNAEGKPLRMSGTNMDITALKEAEERVLKAKEDAERANQAKSEFLSSMSHELRTPLNAILGFTQLFDLDTNLTIEQRTNLAEIRKAGEHLLGLVGDVLDLSKIESGRLAFNAERVIPVRVLRECESLLKSQAEAYGVKLTLDSNSLHNTTINADGIRLKQVFINLISNGIKYNHEGGEVVLRCELTDRDFFRISVCDTGRGIPQIKQKELFQPFNRLGAEHTGIEGNGVGLVITRQLVEYMGGRLSFESTEHLGSTFWVEFPVCDQRAHASDLEVNPEGDVDKLPFLSVNKSKRILYVEDNPSNQRLMVQSLSRYSLINLELCSEALLGIFLARAQKPDLIILDINLPGMDGFEVAEVLKLDPQTQHIPLIALSANALPHDIEKGERLGFNSYLTKPVSLKLLVSALNDNL